MLKEEYKLKIRHAFDKYVLPNKKDTVFGLVYKSWSIILLSVVLGYFGFQIINWLA